MLPRYCLLLLLIFMGVPVVAQEAVSRFEVFDRYDPTYMAHEVSGVEGEHVDLRTLGLSWEVTDFVIPGDGGLDIAISRSFNRLSHTPSDMGHWYFGVPRLQVPTSPWRAPYDPANSTVGTFQAAWANLQFRLNDFGGICEHAGGLVDPEVTASQTGQRIAGIMFAAPVTLYIPGEGSKILLERRDDADQFPADARYVTTDNWYARCLPANTLRRWGGFEVVSPRGLRYRFDFILHLVPGEYALATSGGWVEMGISSVTDAHGNRIRYEYDTGSGGTNLLTGISASDGRRVTLEYYPGSVQGVDVQGSPLSLISKINIHANDDLFTIEYEYCDFADYYILQIGCTPINLGPNRDLPVLHAVRFPDGDRVSYRYNPSLYSVNVQLAWGNFEFLLESVRLPTGGTIQYTYQSGYHPVLQRTNAPAPRLSRRVTGGRDVATGEWAYQYQFANHIETTTVTGPKRKDVYEFYEGLGTYEFLIARYPGQHAWPGTAPTDYDELMGLPKSHSIRRLSDDKLLYRTAYEHALLPYTGKQFYSGNWLGWPTLVLAQIRPRPLRQAEVTDFATAADPIVYTTRTAVSDFDAYAYPLRVIEQGTDVLAAQQPRTRSTLLAWHHDINGWFIGLPASRQVGSYAVHYDYYSGNGLLRRLDDAGMQTDYAYDSNGNLIAESWSRDEHLYIREYAGHHRGVALSESHPVDPESGLVQTLTRSVDDFGRILWTEDGGGNRTTFAYDFKGRIIQYDRPDTAPVQISFNLNSAGDLHQVTAIQANRSRTADIDGFGRTVLLRDYASVAQSQSPRALRWDYDSAGRLAFRSYPFGWHADASPAGFAWLYDEFDRTTRQTITANGQYRTFCYTWECNTGDYAANVGLLRNGFVMTDERGYQSGMEFAALGNPHTGVVVRIAEQVLNSAAIAAPSFRLTTLRRDDNNNVIALSQGATGEPAIEREFIYEHPRLIEERHPETGVTLHNYDSRNNRVMTRVGSAEPVRFAYDGMDRLVLTDYAGSANDIHYSYANTGLLQSLLTGASRWRYSYDGAGRLTEEALELAGKNFALYHRYDQYGNLLSTEYPSGELVDFAPDALGNPTRAGDVVSGAIYRDDGSLQRLIFSNGIQGEYRRNSRLLPRERLFESPDQSLLAGFRYTYDGTGNLLRILDRRDDSQIATMKYDGLGRMVEADTLFGQGSVVYDATDNILANTVSGRDFEYRYDASNKLDSVIAAQFYLLDFDYDAMGNTTRSGGYSYIYNEASQLQGIDELPGLSYSYDGNGRRMKSVDSDGATYSVYNKAGQLAHQDSCEKGGQLSDFVYFASELVGRIDSECTQGCHP